MSDLPENEMLSHREQRFLAEIEHELQRDQTLARLVQQLDSCPPRKRRRTGHILWWVGLALELGALSWVCVGAVLGSQVIVMTSLLFAIVLGIPLVGVATARLLERRHGW